MDQQFRIGTGVQYALSEKIAHGAAYEYLNLGEGDLDRERGAGWPGASRATTRPTRSTSSTSPEVLSSMIAAA